MTDETIRHKRFLLEAAAEAFLDAPNEKSFAALFKILPPQLVALFRVCGSEVVAEDLAQEVMLTVFRKAGQVRDRALFHSWVFTIARHTRSRHWGERAREVETVDLGAVPERLVASNNQSVGTPAFEFHRWMTCLDSQEREALTLRFGDEREYHEIAAAQAIPIGTAQWRVFNAKRKLAPHLKKLEANMKRIAA